MKYCNACVMPNTKPDLTFDEEGVCDACRSAQKKDQDIDWDKRREEFEGIVKKYKGSKGHGYDCIIPVSGGKDSTFQAFMMKYIFKMNPLCVNFEPTYPTELGRKNLENLRRLGFDVLCFKPNSKVYTKLGRDAFFKVGDHEWPNHLGIFTIPIRVAVQYDIPLLVWGENSQLEYGGPVEAAEKNVLDRRWLEEFGGLLGMRVKDLKELGLTEEETNCYIYPTDEELKKVGVFGVFLGSYFKWDARRQTELVKQIGFNVHDGPIEGTYPNYENLDDDIVSLHDYFKYVKFGFGRATDHACLDLRNGRLTREEALRLIAKYDGKLFQNKVDLFCKRFSISKEEFYSVVEKFANKSIFKVNDDGKLVWEDGQLVHLRLKEELKRCGVTEDKYKDVSDIEQKLENLVRNQINNEGYVTGLIDGKKHFNY